MSFGRLKFVASEYMQNSLSGGFGVIGGYANPLVSVKFDNPTLALNVNDRVVANSSMSIDSGNQINLVGRDIGGVVNSDTITLLGTGFVTGQVTFKHLLRVNALSHSGAINVNKASNNSGLLIVPSGANSVKNLFDYAVANQVSYEKVFLKNTSYTNALLNASIYETTNPEGFFAFAVATGKNDGEIITTLSTTPTNCGPFNNSIKQIPGGYLNTGECIGVWIRFSGTNANANYGLTCAGSVLSLIEIDPTGGGESGGNDNITGAGLLQSGDFEYSGSFAYPFECCVSASGYPYGGTALTYNPNNNSLFAAGHDWYQYIGEFSIPTLVKLTGSMGFSSLNRSLPIQLLRPVTDKLPDASLFSITNGAKMGGTLVIGDKLIGSAYAYYDGGFEGTISHYSVNPYNISSGSYSGLYRVGTFGTGQGGFLGGYMGTIPNAHTGVLGGRYFTGQAGLAIIGRSSAGPAMAVFNPHNLANNSEPVHLLIHYPLSHPLADPGTQNELFNTTTNMRGAFFPDGTNSLIFIGRHGTGPFCYGGDECGDTCITSKGPHAQPYRTQIWAYSLSGLVSVKSGLMNNYDIRPYATWTFSLPPQTEQCSAEIGGLAWDSGTRRLYVSQLFAGPNGEPIIHVYKVGIPSG